MLPTIKEKDIALSLFKEPVTPQGHSALGVQAYRMDSDGSNVPAMAEYAGLNKTNKPFCCDYLYIKNKSAVLIEDTHLEATAQNILQKLKHGEPNGSDTTIPHNKVKQKYIKQLIKRKYLLKVYGSLLILCRLIQKNALISKELQDKKFLFWLVITDETNIPVIDNMELKPFLKTSMKDSLTEKQLVKNTEIFFVHQLKEKMQNLQ